MTINVFPTNLQWLGMGKEPSYGVPAAAPTIWTPMVDPKWVPHQSNYKDDSIRGDMAAHHGQTAGMRYDELSFKNYFLLDCLFPDFTSVLGYPDAVSGSGDPYTHQTSLLNTSSGQPASWTLWLYNGSECWQMPGCHLSQASLTMPAEGLSDITKTWMGLAASIVTPPTNTPSQTTVWPGWNTSITLGGSLTPVYSTLKIDLKRETTAIPSLGQQAPLMIFQGALTVTGETTGVYQGYNGTPADLKNYLQSTITTLVAKAAPASDASHYAQWQMSKVGYESVEVTGAAGKYLEANAKFEAYANSTDVLGTTGQSPIKMTMLNAVSTSY